MVEVEYEREREHRWTLLSPSSHSSRSQLALTPRSVLLQHIWNSTPSPPTSPSTTPSTTPAPPASLPVEPAPPRPRPDRPISLRSTATLLALRSLPPNPTLSRSTTERMPRPDVYGLQDDGHGAQSQPALSRSPERERGRAVQPEIVKCVLYPLHPLPSHQLTANIDSALVASSPHPLASLLPNTHLLN